MALLTTIGKISQKRASAGAKLRNTYASSQRTVPSTNAAPPTGPAAKMPRIGFLPRSQPTPVGPPKPNTKGPGKGILALAAMGGVGAGINSTDPVKAGIAEFEESVMGDPNFSRSILGDQMGPGALFGVSGARMGYMGKNLYNTGARYRNTRSSMRDIAPGEMVFGMFNSRMQ